MKVEEIQIGDWVCLDGDFNNDCPLKVTSIDRIGIAITDGKIVSIENVIPISLTAEILLFNGWERKGPPYEWKGGLMVQLWDTKHHSFKILETPDFDGFTFKGIEINEVHKLQHALRLCGLDSVADDIRMY